MNNQPQVSMTITGLMLKSYMIVARTWASANKATAELKSFATTFSLSFGKLQAKQA